MDFYTQQMSQELAIAATPIFAANYAVNTNTNINGWIVGPIDMLEYRRAFGVVNVGVVVGVSAVNCVNVAFLAGNTTNTLQAVTAAAWKWATISGGPTQSVAGNNNLATIEMRADQLPSGQRYLALVISNVQAALFSAELYAGASDYKPAGIGSVANVLNSGYGQLNTVQQLQQSVM